MSSKDKKLLIILAAIIVVAVSYFFVLKPTLEKNTRIENENANLNVKVAELQQMIEKEEEYRNETKRMKSEVELVLAEFPSSLRIENGIMDVVYLEKVTETTIPVLTISEPTLAVLNGQATSADAVVQDTVADAASQYTLYDVNTSLSYDTSYKGLKSLIKEIVTDKNKRSISTIVATYDHSTGKITGSLSFESYFVFGQDKDYEKADIPAIKHGTNNIFGTTVSN